MTALNPKPKPNRTSEPRSSLTRHNPSPLIKPKPKHMIYSESKAMHKPSHNLKSNFTPNLKPSPKPNHQPYHKPKSNPESEPNP